MGPLIKKNIQTKGDIFKQKAYSSEVFEKITMIVFKTKPNISWLKLLLDFFDVTPESSCLACIRACTNA